MFESMTQEAILAKLLARIPDGISKQEGTVTYDVAAALSVELALAYVQLERGLRLGFAHTSSGAYLEMRADEHGVSRKPAVKATGRVTISGTDGAPIGKGAVFATTSGTRFVTKTAAVIVGTTATVDVEAEVAGAAGNVAAGTISVIPVSIPGVSVVTNTLPTTGGFDAETDESLLQRLLLRVRNQATSGNAAHYKLWATEVNGIGDAKVFPQWNGPLTVKVVLLDQNRRAPGTVLVEETAAYIESQRPIGAQVMVVPAPEVPVHLSVDLTLSSGTLAAAKADIENGVQEYLKGLAFTDPIVRFVRIANIVLEASGVQDYTALTVNGGNGNVTIPDGSVAVLGTVNVT
ncbi:baseplate J/gp47 family protein [Gorillibacterium sp. sgz5001074]|uniref:baseplate J/gp47 family protein n=1 Tax=Gorillibacterium sp. sgz5001074 TaxID=3446695 RepID=UPI003F66FA7A